MCAGVWRVICWQGAGWRTADRVVKLSRRMEEPFGRKVEEELMFGEFLPRINCWKGALPDSGTLVLKRKRAFSEFCRYVVCVSAAVLLLQRREETATASTRTSTNVCGRAPIGGVHVLPPAGIPLVLATASHGSSDT